MKHLFTVLSAVLITATGLFAQKQPLTPEITKPVYFDISPPLRDMIQLPPQPFDGSFRDGVIPNYITDPGKNGSTGTLVDPALQQTDGDLPSDTTIQNFDGLNNGSGYVPPDTHGEAGLNHYFQVVNCSYAIFNKTGSKSSGPFANSSIWSGMPHNENSGDAIVHWDEQANRWLFSQFSLPNGSSTAPFYVMIAVSQTSDPTGSWFRYEYEFSSMPDYPKFGVWGDGYYMSTNNFGPAPAGWTGNGAYAFQRDAMLAGDPDALRISFTFPPGSEGFISLLPSDCDGTFPPPGTPNYFTYISTNGTQRLGIIEFHANWDAPAMSTFGNITYLPVNAFNHNGAAGSGIPQLGTDKVLETLADRLMYRQQYRKFSGYSSMVLNHTINGGTGNAGLRWYELRNTGSAWSIYQQATYAPADGNSRWMGSIAQDTAGTIAMGYSVSGSSIYPGIRYTGRLKNDPLNQMTMTEKTIINGGGCQTGIWSGRSRWGDYSGLSIDPASPTTFWFTTEYYTTTSSSVWSTRIASFTFGNVFSSTASSTPSIMCTSASDSVQLKAMGYGGSGSYTYNWSSIPAGFTSNISNPKVKPVQNTKYIATTSDGTTTKHDTTEVRIVPAAVAYAGNDTMVCAWVSAIPMNGSAANYNKLAWGTTGDGFFSNPNSIETDYHPGIKDKSKGEVYVKLIVIPNPPCSGNITDTKYIMLDPCTGIENTDNQTPKFAVSPNPATNSVRVTLTGKWSTPFITIISADGKELYKNRLTPEFEKATDIDISAFPTGIYIVKLQQESHIATQRFIKQ